MYKIFALFVLILAPIAVTVVSGFVPISGPATDSTLQPASSESISTSEQSPPMPAPVVEPAPYVALPPDAGPATAGVPMIDPQGIDPTPHAEGVSTESPAAEAVSGDAPPASNDDRPDS